MKSAYWLLSSLAVLSFIGCKPAEKVAENAMAGEESVDEHAGHDHSHDELGPNGGHILDLKPANAHAEWAHDDESHLITVYLHDFEDDKVKDAKFVAKVGDEIEEFPLTAGESGWTVASEALMTHINMGEAAEVTLVVTDDNGQQSAKIEAHEHHHH